MAGRARQAGPPCLLARCIAKQVAAAVAGAWLSLAWAVASNQYKHSRGPPPVLQPHAARRIAAPLPASEHGHPHPAAPGMDRVTLNTTVKFLSVERNTTTILHYYIQHSLFIATKVFSPDI